MERFSPWLSCWNHLPMEPRTRFRRCGSCRGSECSRPLLLALPDAHYLATDGYDVQDSTRFDKAHFDRFISRKLGNDFIGAEMKTGKHRLWQTRILEPPTLFHHEMLVEVPFNPIQYQSMQMRMQVPMLPILKGATTEEIKEALDFFREG